MVKIQLFDTKKITDQLKGLLLLCLLSVVVNANSQDKNYVEADLLIVNAKIVSGPFTPTYSAMAIKEGKIIGLYRHKRDYKKIKAAKIENAQKKFILPSFIDGHCHFLGLGKAMDEVNLFGTKSWNEVVERVKAFKELHPNKEWILGMGWDQNDWSVKEFPDNSELDRLFPNNFIVLRRIDGHAVVANSKALEYAKLNTQSKCMGGELILKNNTLSGVLVDNAVDLLTEKMPKPGHQDKIKWLLSAQNECVKYGISQICDAGLPIEDILLIDSLCKSGALQMRFYLMASPDAETLSYFIKNGALINDKVRCRSVKLYSDGALGSRGALLKEPYCDSKESYGLQLIEPFVLDSLLRQIYDMGFQANTHCIGDSANSLVLKAYAKILQKTQNDFRWRIEHAQVVDPSDLHLFLEYSIIPSVQPTHATSDMYWAENRLCKNRMEGSYSYKSLLDHSPFISLGTDFPIEYVSPFNTIRAARFRQDAQGFPKEGFNKKEQLSSKETFAGMTLWAAKGDFWEQETGTLQVGKLADFIIMDENPYSASLERLNVLKINKLYISGVEINH